MNNTQDTKPAWQTSLEHYESLCTERYETIHRDIQSLRDEMKDFKDEMRGGNQALRNEMNVMRDDIRELRIGQRWMIGAMLMWPPLMIAALKML